MFILASAVVRGAFSGSAMTGPRPPVSRSTRFGTLPAAILRPMAAPLIAAPSRNCAAVHADATVVSSLIVARAGGSAPSVDIMAAAAFVVPSAEPSAAPPVATR